MWFTSLKQFCPIWVQLSLHTAAKRLIAAVIDIARVSFPTFGTVTQFASPRFEVGSVAGLAAVSGPGVGALPPAGLGAGAAGGGAGGPAAPARPAAVHLCHTNK